MSAKKREFQPGQGFSQEDWDEVADSPELTAADLAMGKPFNEAFPELAASIRRPRGKQKTPTKELVSLRVDRETLTAYRATGPGWQSRMNKALRDALPAGQKKHG